MKILIFNPLYTAAVSARYEKYYVRSGARWPHSGIKRKGTIPHYLPFPFFLAYAAAWLKREGFEVAAFDCVALDMAAEEFIGAAKAEKPDICFFETATTTINRDLALVKRLREALPGAKIVLGGPHSSVYSEDTLKGSPGTDFILKGEYEGALVDLAKALRDGTDPAGVTGLTYRREGAVLSTPPRGLISPLDQLPLPAYEMFPSSRAPDPAVYWDGFCQYRPAIQMHASRGCPYRCDFCLWNQVMYDNGRYRTFTASRIVDDMAEVIKRYGAKEIYFDDDDFTISAAQVKAIADEIVKRGLDVKWSCMGDAINVTEPLIQRMAESGCVGIKFGIESGSPRVMKSLGKPVDLSKVRDIVKWCGARGIKTHATFTLGLAEDDQASIKETLTYLENFDCDTIQVSVCTPLPGTKFFRNAESKGLLKTTDWDKYDGKAGDVMKHPNLDLNEVAEMRSRALRKWLLKRLLSPAWLSRQARYFFRVLKGLGPGFIFTQLRGIAEDEFMISRFRKYGPKA